MSYTLNLGTTGTAKVYNPAIGQDSMSVSSMPISSSSTITLTVTETPVFVIPNPTALRAANPADSTDAPGSANNTVNKMLQESAINVYPNPTTSSIHFTVDNDSQNDLNVTIFNETGRTYGKYSFKKTPGRFTESIDMSNLPSGIYLMEISQGNERVVKKVLKLNK
jgi:hypothetical protein